MLDFRKKKYIEVIHLCPEFVKFVKKKKKKDHFEYDNIPYRSKKKRVLYKQEKLVTITVKSTPPPQLLFPAEFFFFVLKQNNKPLLEQVLDVGRQYFEGSLLWL